MNIETIRAQLDLVNQQHQTNPAVLEAKSEVSSALESSSKIPKPWDWENCVNWSAADAGWLSRSAFKAQCQGWAAELKDRLLRLASQLRVAGDDGRAEVIASLADETTTAVQVADDVVGDAGTYWDTTPVWTRYALLGLALLVAAKAVK